MRHRGSPLMVLRWLAFQMVLRGLATPEGVIKPKGQMRLF